MREEARKATVPAPDATMAEPARERAAHPAAVLAAEPRPDPFRREVRPAPESPEVVRVEVSQRQAAGTAARPVIVVQVELPPGDAPQSDGRAGLHVERALEESPRLALEPTRSRELGDPERSGQGASTGAFALLPRPENPESPRPQPRRLASLPIAVGLTCPRCGEQTYHEPTPWFLRPVRWALLGGGSWRRCPSYHWSGLALRR